MFNFLKRQHFVQLKGQPRRLLRRMLAVWLILGLAGLFLAYKLLDRHVDRLVADLLTELIEAETGNQYQVSFGDIRLNFARHELTIFDFSLEPKEKDLGHFAAQHRNVYHVQVPKFQLTLGSAWELVLWRRLNVTGVQVLRPFINMDNFPGDRPLTLARESGNLYNLISDYLKLFRVSHFRIRDASFCLTNHLATGSWSQTFRNVSFSLENFLVDEASEKDRSKIFYTDAFELSIQQQEIYLPDSLHVFTFDRLAINTDSAQVVFKNFQLYPRQGRGIRHRHPDKSIYDLRVPDLVLRGVDFARAYNDNALVIAQIEMASPSIFVNQATSDAQPKGQKVVSAVPSALSELFGQIVVRDFHLANAAFDLEKDLQPQVRVEAVDLQLLDFHIDSASTLGRNALPQYRDFVLRVKNQTFHLADSAYTLHLDELLLSSPRSLLELKGLAFRANQGVPPGPLPLRRLTVERARLAYRDFRQALDHGNWQVGELLLDGVGAELVPPGAVPRPGPRARGSQKRLQFTDFFTSLVAQSVRLERVNLRYFDARHGDSLALAQGHFHFRGLDWRLGQDLAGLPTKMIARLAGARFASLALTLPRWGQAATVGQFDWLAQSGRALAQEVRLQPLGVVPGGLRFVAYLPKLAIEGLDLPATLRTGQARLTGLQLERPDLLVQQTGVRDITSEAKAAANRPALLQGLEGANLQVLQGKFRWQKDGHMLANIDGLALRAPAWAWGQFAAPSFWASGIHLDGAELELGQFSFQAPDGRWRFKAEAAGLDQAQGRAWLVGGQVAGPVGLQFAKASASGLDLAEFWAKGTLRWEAVRLMGATLDHRWQDKSLRVDDLDLALAEGAFSVRAQSGRRDNWPAPRELGFAKAEFRAGPRTLVAGRTRAQREADGHGLGIWAHDLAYTGGRVQVQVPTLVARGFQLAALANQQALLVDSIGLARPKVTLVPAGDGPPPPRPLAPAEALAQLGLSQLAIGAFRVEEGALTTQLRWDGHPFVHTFGQLSLWADGWHWPSGPTHGMEGDLRLLAGPQKLTVPPGTPELAWQSLAYSTASQCVLLSGASFRPPNRDTDAAGQSLGTNQVRLQAKHLRLHRPDWPALLAGDGLRLGVAELDSFQVQVHRDRRRGKVLPRQKDLPAVALQRLAWPLRIDTVYGRWGRVNYQEIMPKAGGADTARLEFGQVNGTLANVANRPLAGQTHAELNLRAKLMDQGNVSLEVRFDLASPTGAHEIEASGSDLDLTSLNAMLEPLARVRVEKGQMDNFELRASANDTLATGKMFFYYHDLKFSLIDKKKPQRPTLKTRISALAANLLVRNRNLRSLLYRGNRGNISYERPAHRSMFAYWGRIVMAGVVSSVTGIQQDLQDHLSRQQAEAEREERQSLRQSVRQSARQEKSQQRRFGKKIDEDKTPQKKRRLNLPKKM
jgi:Domain of Unknown Function (DUF748)